MDAHSEIERTGWFRSPGAYFIVDGQFGSTGKGALAAFLGASGDGLIDMVTTNAGPNSGHTGYLPSVLGGEKIVTRQIPVAAVVLKKINERRSVGRDVLAYLNAGAIIDPNVLMDEIRNFGFGYGNLMIHPIAAVIDPLDVDAEHWVESGPAKIASTGKGVGAALARKVMRQNNVVRNLLDRRGTMRPAFAPFCRVNDHYWDPSEVVLVETAQGFSLGLNSRFYPYVTSRECTVQQAMADARMPLSLRRKVAMCVRTFPIRVGNTDAGTSGPGYSDQRETTWEELGREPELTTVTGRQRRVFTWSRMQFREAVHANEPDLLFVTFMDYLPEEEWTGFMHRLIGDYLQVRGRPPETVLYSTGPRPEDISVWDQT